MEKGTKRISALRTRLLKTILIRLTRSYLRNLRMEHRLSVEQLSERIRETRKKGGLDDFPLTPELIKKYENGLLAPGKHLYQIFYCVNAEEKLTEYSFECSRIFHRVKTLVWPMLLFFFCKQCLIHSCLFFELSHSRLCD